MVRRRRRIYQIYGLQRPLEMVCSLMRDYEEDIGLNNFIAHTDFTWDHTHVRQRSDVYAIIQEFMRSSPEMIEKSLKYTDWEDLKDDLIKSFTGGITLEEAEANFKNIKQEKCEDVELYYKRLDRAADCIILIYRLDGIKYSDEFVREQEKKVASEKFKYFIDNAGPSLRNFYSMRKPKSLIQALSMVAPCDKYGCPDQCLKRFPQNCIRKITLSQQVCKCCDCAPELCH